MLTNVIVLCGTDNIPNNSPFDIALCLKDIGVCFQNNSHCTKHKVFY